MVATLTSVYCGEESLYIRGICSRYRSLFARAHRWQNNGSVTQPAEYFREGASRRAVGTFSGKHLAVRWRATAVRSPYRHFCLGLRQYHVMQAVGEQRLIY